jgi:hypothetical protein
MNNVKNMENMSMTAVPDMTVTNATRTNVMKHFLGNMVWKCDVTIHMKMSGFTRILKNKSVFKPEVMRVSVSACAPRQICDKMI